MATPIKEVGLDKLIVMCAAKIQGRVEEDRPIPSTASAVASRVNVRLNVVVSGRAPQMKCLDYVQSGHHASGSVV